jgi:hypothetical protein
MNPLSHSYREGEEKRGGEGRREEGREEGMIFERAFREGWKLANPNPTGGRRGCCLKGLFEKDGSLQTLTLQEGGGDAL